MPGVVSHHRGSRVAWSILERLGRFDGSSNLPYPISIMDNAGARLICRALLECYGGSGKYPVNRGTPFEILVLTILSAQTTDASVEKIRRRLFECYPDPHALAGADVRDVKALIRSVGLYHTKTRNIVAAARILVEEYGGSVPAAMDDLLRLPGVGRKTANIVLHHAFGKNEGVAVDTHVSRLAQRIGLSRHTTPEKIEHDLMALFPQSEWGLINHLLVQHGRTCCRGYKPHCERCIINARCRYYLKREKQG